MRNRLTLALFAIAMLCFVAAACATPQQTAAVATAVTGAAAALIDSLAPLLPPEKLAQLQNTASTIDGSVQATAKAVGTLADAIAQIKTAASAQIQQVAEGVQKVAVQVAAAPSQEQVYLVGSGSAAAGAGASRYLSHLKHSKKVA